LNGIACLVFFSFLLGKHSGAHLILFGFTCVPVLIFDNKETRRITALSVLPIVSFLFLEYKNFQAFFSNHIPTEIGNVTYISGALTSFIFILFQIIVYKNMTKKFTLSLARSNKSLSEINTHLQTALKESEKQRKELKKAHLGLKQKEIMDKEIEIAQQIQSPLMPQFTPQYKGFDISVVYKACRHIGGDYYDFIPNGANELFGLISDITGKGIPASIMTTHFREMVHKHIKPNESLYFLSEKLNNLILNNRFIQKAIYITLWKLNTEKNTFTYTVNGMDPGFLLRDNKVILLNEARWYSH